MTKRVSGPKSVRIPWTPLAVSVIVVLSSAFAVQPVRDAATARQKLLDQLVSPVRWTQEIAEMAKRHPDATFVEMGPGNVLTGLMGRLVKGARTFTCGTASDVEKLQQMVS